MRLIVELAAYLAAEALCRVNMSVSVLKGDRRASELHACLAGLALVGIYLDRLTALNLLKESAGSSGDDYGRLFCCEFFLNSCFSLSEVVRIYYSYSVDAHSTYESFEVDLACRIATEIETCCRILLVASHTCDGVIKDDDC